MNKDAHNSPKPSKPKSSEDFPLQEYRLVPVEEWDDRQGSEDEIDLVELAKHIWDRRMFIAKVTGVFVVIGLLIALLMPKEYQTSATLLPEAQSSSSMAGSLLQQYGGLLGMSGGLALEEEGTIPPQLYPQIVQSLPFQIELLNKEVTFAEPDTTTTVYNFFDEIYTPSVFSYAMEYTIGLPGKIIGLFKEEAPEQPLPKGFETDSIISVTKDQMAIIENMRERVSVSLDEESGVLTLTAEMPDPKAAAQVGQMSIELLKEYVTGYRTEKAMQDLEFAQEQLEQAEERFREVQARLAEFRDSNLNLVTAKAQTQEQRLESEYDLAFSIYTGIAQRVEQAKMAVQEQTPVVSVLQPVKVPLKDVVSGFTILFVTAILGLLVSLGYTSIRFIVLGKK